MENGPASELPNPNIAQRIVHEGNLWQLARDGDANSASSWVEQSMWLTTAGGLFFNGAAQSGPCGRHVGGLRAEAASTFLGDHFAFQILDPEGTPAASTLTLAAASAEERDTWLRHICGLAERADSGTSLSPMDIYSKGGQGRRRSQTQLPQQEPGEILQLHELAPAIMETPEPSERGAERASSCEDFGEDPVEEFGTSQPSVPAIPAGCEVRRNSQAAYAEKNHTTLVLDWDDTIFPTTWVRSDCKLNWRLPLAAQLKLGPRFTLIQTLLDKHLQKVQAFFAEASASANIIIVTLAKRPWVEMSMQNFMPGLRNIIQTLDLKVIYAQEYITAASPKDYQRSEFQSSEEVSKFYSGVKGTAISIELDELHKKYDASWKNIISLGDSDFERYGTINAGEDYMRRDAEGSTILETRPEEDGGTGYRDRATSATISKDGHLKRLRTKTVKMLGEPTVEELTAQLVLLTMWLPYMVRKDGGFDVEIEGTDDDARLNEMHKSLTGADASLSWQVLAGLQPAPDEAPA